MARNDRTFGKVDISDFYYDDARYAYYEEMSEYRAGHREHEPFMPPPEPVALGYSLEMFQKANDRNTIFRLKDARVLAGLSQRALATILGVSQQAVAKVERTGSDPKLSTLRAYASAVGLQITHELRILGHFDPYWKDLERAQAGD